jgi:hypothetical protein
MCFARFSDIAPHDHALTIHLAQLALRMLLIGACDDDAIDFLSVARLDGKIST